MNQLDLPCCLWFFLFLPLCLLGQERPVAPAIEQLGTASAEGWYKIAPNQSISPETFLKEHLSDLGLQPTESVDWLKSEQDALGFQHDRYQLTFKNLPIEGAQLLLHSQAGSLKKMNGDIPPAIEASAHPQLTGEQALSLAKQHMGAVRYMWEYAGNEEMVQYLHKDPHASLLPKPELMWATPAFRPPFAGHRLAWKIDLYAAEPHSRKWIYVDAQTGEVFKELETLHTANSVGTAVTKYHGIRSITTDSTDQYFRLRETNRLGTGINIETYDMNEGTDYGQAVDFRDDDNYWNNFNEDLDEAATDAHWGAEMTHDYFWLEHNRSSFDDQGSHILSYIHYEVNFFNAFWNGVWMTFGDGNSAPLTSLDVVSHEFSHGVTGNSAGLIYAYESGALNESFSDIFGNAVEHYADDSLADWRVGEGFGQALRDMSNPGNFGDPDTYKGQNWVSSSFDNGGVHINSGVQNYWYYLLVEGGSGVNDNGEAFQVDAIGWEKASNIAYRNLTTYLTPISQFSDALQGSLAAAEDLYGVCSDEYIATANAWFAVGVGDGIRPNDFGVSNLYPIEACGTSTEEFVTIDIAYFGCDTFPGGDLFVTYFATDPAQTAVESITLPSLSLGQTHTYQFQQALDMSQVGTYELQARTLFPGDAYQGNNTSEVIFPFRYAALDSARISFESFPSGPVVLDSLVLNEEADANAEVRSNVGTNGSHALLMEGGPQWDFQIIFPGGLDPMDFNLKNRSMACMCVDASELTGLELSFDLRQTFSRYWETNLNRDSSWAARRVNNLRLLVNGEEISRYRPVSHENDPFENHTLNLDAYVGGPLTICWEQNANMSQQNDPFDIGDRSLIDNINLSPTRIISSQETGWVGKWEVYPNPSGGQFQVAMSHPHLIKGELTITNSMGQLIWERSLSEARQQIDLSIDASQWPEGVYWLNLIHEGGEESKVLVKQ
ncbi:MAG: M4 family metallopeptidase [Bacteroidota bacterium]